ncbi:MAG: sigma-70 family RNA polymerase sigma factor [Dehalococcoidia bacterium]
MESPATTPAEFAADQIALIDAARARDRDAWARLFDEHFQSLYRYSYYRVRDHHVAEELAAQVFEEAFRGIKRFDYRGISIRAWFFKIARNITADHIKKAASRATAPLIELADGRDEFANAGIRTDVLRALAQLTEEQQQVIVMRFLEDLAINDCAEVIGKSVDAVKSLQARALVRLREILQDEDTSFAVGGVDAA